MHATSRVLGIAALAGAVGSCAALSGLSTYTTDDCPQGCDGGVGAAPSADVAAPVADATAIREDAAPGDDVPASDDAVAEDGAGGAALDVAADVANAGLDAGSGMDANGGGDIDSGLVAFYKFDEISGTTAADSSGNHQTATLVGAGFSGGLQNNALTMSGSGEYASLPSGIASGLTSFSIGTWVNLYSSTQAHLFDFGTGTTAYMFLTPNSGGSIRFSITTGGAAQEQQLNATALAQGSWHQVTVTLAASTGTLYVDGAQVAQNTSMTLNPSSLGTTTNDWLGRSQFATDPYLNGRLDNFRIYDRALTAGEIQTLYANQL